MTAAPLDTVITPPRAGHPVPARGTVDVHQHLWPEALFSALSQRRRPPFLTRRPEGWVLVCAGEPDWPVDPRDHDPLRRADLARADETDLVLVAPSCPLGIEALPAREALPLIEAYHVGVAGLPAGFRPWASVPLDAPDPVGLDDLLDDGFVGLCLPAGALTTPAGARSLSALLDVLESRGAPLFVHPGPAPWSPVPPHPAGAGTWWPAMTTYVAQMQAAWHMFQAHVRPTRPDLRVCFAMLAGLAPLQADRLKARAGTRWEPHPRTFLDTSSYTPGTVAAVAAVTGARSIVHGTDRPVVDPGPHPGDGARRANPIRLLTPEEAK